jgi:hypothetical protein
MSANQVTLNATFVGGPNDKVEGSFAFSPSGSLYDPTSNSYVAAQVQQGLLANPTLGQATLSVTLLASDNYAAGVLTWDVHIRARSIPEIQVANLTVNFAAGATQNLFTVLLANGWTPVVIP